MLERTSGAEALWTEGPLESKRSAGGRRRTSPQNSRESILPTNTPRQQAPLVLVGAAAFGLCGLVVARLTLGLNPAVHADLRDSTVLLVLFWLVYATVGAVAGLLATGLLRALCRVAPGLALRGALPVAGALLAAPLLYALLLPDVGLAPTLLTPALLGSSRGYTALFLLAAGALSAVLGSVGILFIRRVGRPLGRRRWLVPAVLWVGVVAFLAFLSFASRPPAETLRAPAGDPLAGWEPPSPALPPVVLLCIDGADPDDVIEPLMARGELPYFARLRRMGVWGELETLEPALSPAIWTTLITGKSPAEHGIHHFVYFQLPGMRRPILGFPLHTGLNFRLFPWLERLPGAPSFRRPYTSDMRQVPALWNMTGEHLRVGVYGWRASWPPEEVNGFHVAAGVALLEAEDGRMVRSGSAYPPSLLRRLTTEPRLVSDAELERYLGPISAEEADPDSLAEIENSLQDRTARDLRMLWRRFSPRFLAAGFYSVDGFQHRFGLARVRGGPFSSAVDERYRYVDARLGALMKGLGSQVNIIVVSDHGFDFAGNNHTHGPPGLFVARGPSFRRGVEVEGLSVYDVAPLVLHLLGLPVATDMPGARRGVYRQVLTPRFLKEVPGSIIPSYGRRRDADMGSVLDPMIEETKRRLKTLGYID